MAAKFGFSSQIIDENDKLVIVQDILNEDQMKDLKVLVGKVFMQLRSGEGKMVEEAFDGKLDGAMNSWGDPVEVTLQNMKDDFSTRQGDEDWSYIVDTFIYVRYDSDSYYTYESNEGRFNQIYLTDMFVEVKHNFKNLMSIGVIPFLKKELNMEIELVTDIVADRLD